MIYRLTHHNTEATAKVYYVNGVFDSVHIQGAGMVPLLFEHGAALLNEDELHGLAQHGFEVQHARELMPNEKLALWCRLYKEFKGVAYKATGKDVGLIKKLEVNEGLLRYYMDDAKLPHNSTTWLWRGKQSVANLSTYYNQVRASMVAPAEATSKHPNNYNREYERKLDGPGITAYRQHLRSLGLEPIADRSGQIIDYMKPDASAQ